MINRLDPQQLRDGRGFHLMTPKEPFPPEFCGFPLTRGSMICGIILAVLVPYALLRQRG